MACGLWLVATRASRGPSGKATARAQILILLENPSILPGRFKDAATPCLGNCIKTVFLALIHCFLMEAPRSSLRITYNE